MNPAGRFAPSPSGLLHFGSLLAAAGSYLDARHSGGRWLLRIEDLDRPRSQPGAETAILATLTAFGFRPDGPVARQSERIRLYEAALQRLDARGLVFPCDCSRREIAVLTAPGQETQCVRDCRSRLSGRSDACLRVALDGLEPVQIVDRSLGPVLFDPVAHRDVIIRRRDGIFSYHFAVVVDDADQGISDVVRGADLLGSTPWQLGLQKALGIAAPRYLHLPVVVEPDGSKLAKSRRALPVSDLNPRDTLADVLRLLGQPGDRARHEQPMGDYWRAAIAAWDPGAFRGVDTVPAPLLTQ